MGLLAIIPAMLAHWVYYLFFLSFYGPFTLLLPLIVLMDLLFVIYAMLAHWVCYLFVWASTTHLLYF